MPCLILKWNKLRFFGFFSLSLSPEKEKKNPIIYPLMIVAQYFRAGVNLCFFNIKLSKKNNNFSPSFFFFFLVRLSHHLLCSLLGVILGSEKRECAGAKYSVFVLCPPMPSVPMFICCCFSSSFKHFEMFSKSVRKPKTRLKTKYKREKGREWERERHEFGAVPL